MELKLERIVHSENDTVGVLLIDCKWAAWTMEDKSRKHKIKGETCIPYGRYKLGLYQSPKFSSVYKHKMIHLLDVPGFEYILIHPGNNNKDTAGCILVADGISPIRDKDNAIQASAKAYQRIYPAIAEAIERGDNVFLTIMDI